VAFNVAGVSGIATVSQRAVIPPTLAWTDPPRLGQSCSLEVFAGLLKGCAAALLAGVGAGIEAAVPLPAFNGIGLTDAARNGADMDVAAIDVPAIGTFVVTATGKNAHRTSLSVPERLSISKSNRDLIVSRMNSGRSARRLRFLIGFRVCAAWALQLFLPGSSRQRTISVRPRTGAYTVVHASPAAPRCWYRCLRFRTSCLV